MRVFTLCEHGFILHHGIKHYCFYTESLFVHRASREFNRLFNTERITVDPDCDDYHNEGLMSVLQSFRGDRDQKSDRELYLEYLDDISSDFLTGDMAVNVNEIDD